MCDYVLYCSQDGASPLWIASQMGHSVIVKELLESSADVDAAREVWFMLRVELFFSPL